MAENFLVEIITPDRVFYSGQASMLEFNTETGEIGVYARHIPVTTVLRPGIVTIHEENGEKKAAVHGGFAEILGNRVTLLAEVAEWPEEIDEHRAEEAKERAEERLKAKTENLDIARAEMSLKRALTRIELLK